MDDRDRNLRMRQVERREKRERGRGFPSSVLSPSLLCFQETRLLILRPPNILGVIHMEHLLCIWLVRRNSPNLHCQMNWDNYCGGCHKWRSPLANNTVRVVTHHLQVESIWKGQLSSVYHNGRFCSTVFNELFFSRFCNGVYYCVEKSNLFPG